MARAKVFRWAAVVETALSREILTSGIEEGFLIFFWGDKRLDEAFQLERAQA